MISNVSGDERGKLAGGKAGDQTGNEWRIRSWYNRPWLCVLRHPNAEVRKCLAKLARAGALNDMIGYDQGTVGNSEDRYSFWYQLKAVGFDPAKIATPCETDCSAAEAAMVKAVGYILGIAALKNISIYLYTGNMRAAFKAAGFQVLTDSKYLTSDAYLLEGDVLLNDSHHVATNLTDGSKSGGSGSSGGSSGSGSGSGSSGGTTLNRSPKWTGYVDADELNVRTWAGTGYPTCSFSPLYQGEAIDVCDTVKADTGKDWYYIRKKVGGEYKYGFVSSAYIIKQATASAPAATATTTTTTAPAGGNEATIYKFLTKTLGLNKAAACGVLANLQAESGMQSAICETLCLKRLKENGKAYTSATYTAAVDNGKIGRAEFLNPLPGKQYGYGLVQWTSPGRKAGLYDLAKKKGVSIGDMNMQLEYLADELKKSYASVLAYLQTVPDTAQGAYDAAYRWCAKYEIPANTAAVSASRGKVARDTFWPKYK